MRKLQHGPDYSDPEVRRCRHIQKCIDFARAYMSESDFVWWLTGYLYEEEWADDEMERISGYLRQVQENVSGQASSEHDDVGAESLGRAAQPVVGETTGGREPEGAVRGMRGRNVSPLEPWNYTKFYRQVGRGG